MTVSTVMQLQKHQPGSRRFTILAGDSQGQQHIAVMVGQMLAGEVGLQLRITYGGKQLGHRAPKPPVRQEKIRHLKNKVRDAFLSQIVGAERLGNLPSDAPHLHFQLLLLHIPARNAESGAIAEAVILAENHPCIRHAQNACGAGHIIEHRQQELKKLDELVKARFVELFGDGNHPHIALIDLIIEGAGLSYGIVQPGDDGTGDMGVLRPVDMVDGKISTASIKYIDRSIGDGFKKTELYGDELLITVRGTTGITALTDIRFNGMNVTRGIAVVRYDRNKINPVYLNAYLNTDESQRYIQEHTRGATLQQINLSDLRVQQIMVPPLALQEQMAAFIEQTDKSKVVEAIYKANTLFITLNGGNRYDIRANEF